MSVTTSQQINTYYNLFKEVEVTFNKQVINVLGLLPKQVSLKCGGESYPCIIYSTSMVGANVIANLEPGVFKILREAKSAVSLRYSFKISYKPYPISFYVSSKITGHSPYGDPGDKEKSNLNFISLTYTKKPPDNLIEMLGELLEANANAQKRKDVRIIITPRSMKALALDSRETTVEIESVPRKCIIRDICFSGAKVLLVGVAKFLLNKPAVIYMSFDDQHNKVKLPGKIIRFEDVEGRKDITALAIQFEEANLPIAYKMYINKYLRTHRLSLEKGQL